MDRIALALEPARALALDPRECEAARMLLAEHAAFGHRLDAENRINVATGVIDRFVPRTVLRMDVVHQKDERAEPRQREAAEQ